MINKTALKILTFTAPALVFVGIAPLYFDLTPMQELSCLGIFTLAVSGTIYNACKKLDAGVELVNVRPQMKSGFVAIAALQYLTYPAAIAGVTGFAFAAMVPWNPMPLVISITALGFAYGVFYEGRLKTVGNNLMGLINIVTVFAFIAMMVKFRDLPRVDTIIPEQSTVDKFLSQIAVFQVFGVGVECELWDKTIPGRTKATKLGTLATLACVVPLIMIYELIDPYFSAIVIKSGLGNGIVTILSLLLFGTVAKCGETYRSLMFNCNLSDDEECVKSNVKMLNFLGLAVIVFILLRSVVSPTVSLLLAGSSSAVTMLLWSFITMEDDNNPILGLAFYVNVTLFVFEFGNFLRKTGII